LQIYHEALASKIANRSSFNS